MENEWTHTDVHACITHIVHSKSDCLTLLSALEQYEVVNSVIINIFKPE